MTIDIAPQINLSLSEPKTLRAIKSSQHYTVLTSATATTSCLVHQLERRQQNANSHCSVSPLQIISNSKRLAAANYASPPPPLQASLGMVGTRLGNIEPASSPPLPDRAQREQQESPSLEPGNPNPQRKITVNLDSPFDGNINPADSSELELFLAATKGPDSKERITLGPETAILFLQIVRSLLSLYGWVCAISVHF